MSNPAVQVPETKLPESRVLSCPGVRHGLMALGWACVGLGFIGLFVPLMPTTVFLLIALWAFSKCSLRFHCWLYTHPRLGRPLRDWHVHGIVPLRAKVLAVAVMAGSLLYVTLFVADDWMLPAGLAAVLGAIAAYIVTRPHRRTAELSVSRAPRP
jgi:uncharacterized membrane protein YbaN (DUF454 family)